MPVPFLLPFRALKNIFRGEPAPFPRPSRALSAPFASPFRALCEHPGAAGTLSAVLQVAQGAPSQPFCKCTGGPLSAGELPGALLHFRKYRQIGQ